MRFLIFLIFSLTVSLAFTQEVEILANVRKLYTISDDHLINYEGQIFTKIPFKSSLHENLSYQLKDPKCANDLYNAYATHILPTLNEASKEAFERAVLKVCQLVGTGKKRSARALFKALKESGFPFEQWLKTYPLAFNHFVDELHHHRDKPSSKLDGPLRIALTTTTSAGGNLSVALAVKAYLDQFPELFETTLLDYETFASVHDPVKIATGKYTVDNIFRLLQEHNRVDELVPTKDKLCQDLAQYIPYRTAAAFKAEISKLHPHLIISTRSYCPDDFNLLSLNIPFRMLYCDHTICFFQQDFVGKVDPKRVKFWLPAASPRFFKSLFKQYNQESIYQLTDNWQTLMKKLAQITHSPLKEIQSTFEVIGYPVRLEFQKIKEGAVLDHFKSKWDLLPGEQGILVEMGVNGVGIIENIFNALKSAAPHSFPIKYFFVCGRNEELRRKLTQRLQENLECTALRRCAILGYMEAVEKNELMNICSLMISKPGGATQAEVTKLRLPMFLMHIQKICEEGNKEKLLEDNLAYEYDPEKPLPLQIEEVLNKIKMTPIHAKDPKWKQRLLKKLLEFRESLSE